MTSCSSVAATYVPEQSIAMTFFSTAYMASVEPPLGIAKTSSICSLPSAPQNREQQTLDRRNEIVVENLPLVKALATRVLDTVPTGVELCDLEHAGVLGLVDAAAKYDDSKGIPFPCYAKHRIRGAILDSLRQLDPVSRDTRRRCKKVEAATNELSASLGRPPLEAELAERLGMDIGSFRQMRIGLRYTGAVSASTPVGEDESSAPRDFPADISARPDCICAENQLRELLGETLSILPLRYQEVLKLYYQEDMTMKEIGQIMGVNESRISQIHKAGLARMADTLRKNGIENSGMALYN